MAELHALTTDAMLIYGIKHLYRIALIINMLTSRRRLYLLESLFNVPIIDTVYFGLAGASKSRDVDAEKSVAALRDAAERWYLREY